MTYYARIWGGFFTAIFLVISTGILRPPIFCSESLKTHFWTKKVFDKKKYNIVFLGDSRVYQGINTLPFSQLFKHLKIEALNFGFSSGSLNSFMLDKASARLADTGHPIIVLGISPFSLTSKAGKNEHYLQEQQIHPLQVYYHLYLLPHLSFFDPISLDILSKHFGMPSKIYKQSFEPNGWVASERIPRNIFALIPHYKTVFKDNPIDSTLLKNLYKQVNIWVESGIQVYAFRPPSSSKMEAIENKKSHYLDFNIDKNIEKSGGSWIEIPSNIKSQLESYDGSHLDPKSATILSTYLANKIASPQKN